MHAPRGFLLDTSAGWAAYKLKYHFGPSPSCHSYRYSKLEQNVRSGGTVPCCSKDVGDCGAWVLALQQTAGDHLPRQTAAAGACLHITREAGQALVLGLVAFCTPEVRALH